MPIEIKELHIKAVVAPEPAANNAQVTAAMLEKLKKEIVRECMQELKTVLNEQKER
jgi:hypothetical protein